MGKKAPQAPPPPNPYDVAKAQTGYNLDTAMAQQQIGNVNQSGPFGNVSYNQTGTTNIGGRDVPQYTQNTTLSPEIQALFDQSRTELGSDFGSQRRRVEDALFARLNPSLERDREALETQLINQGFQRGTEGFDEALAGHGRNVNDARLGVTAQGLGEQQGLFNMALGRFGAATGLAPQPQYNAPTLQPVDLSGNVYNTAAIQNQQYQQQMEERRAQLSGMYGIGSAAVGGGAYVAGKKWGGP